MDCHKCAMAQAEVNGLREVVRSQGEFIQKLKTLIAEYTTTDAQRLDKRRR